MKSSRRSNCPVACVLDLIGDRWTLLVVRDLVLGKRRFEEFLQSAENIATNILSDRLRSLCESGLVKKTPSSEDRRKFDYELTEKGGRLAVLVKDLADWGLANIPHTRLAKQAMPHFRN